MQRTSILFLLSALALNVSACGTEHVTAIDERSSTLAAEDQPLPGDRFGACDEETFACSVPDAGCGGWSEATSQGNDLSRVTCMHSCARDTDCPVPGSGDAAPVCHEQFCQLRCDDGVACPNGFSCVAPSGGSLGYFLSKVCMQTFAATRWVPPTN